MLIGARIFDLVDFQFDPFWAYYDLFTTAFGSLKNIGETLHCPWVRCPILNCTRISVHLRQVSLTLVCHRLKPWQGWVSAVWFAVIPWLAKEWFQLSVQSLSMQFAGIDIFGICSGILRACRTSEVIVTIMMNYIILYVANNIIRFWIYSWYVAFFRSASNKVVSKLVIEAGVLISITGGSRVFNIGLSFWLLRLPS